jgi:hypothetical protein
MKVVYIVCLFTCFTLYLSGQQGLEKIIVEKYYVSTPADKAVDGDGGELPVGSVTYRVFVDMLPGYIFQAAYGTPEHELRIASSTRFFNNEDRGARHPTYSRSQAENNTVMLDSWLSVGAGLRDHIGLLKSRDDGANTIINSDGVLQNADSRAGIPLTLQDGIIPGVSEPVTVVGFFDTDLSLLDDANDGPVPAIISSFDGAWSSLNGSTGPDPEENIVLIGQFTTDGVFTFELNLQIRNQQTLGVENYVAKNPGENEILFEGLIHIDSLELESATSNLINLEDKVSVFPNPSYGDLSIQLDETVILDGKTDKYILQAMDGSSITQGRITGSTTSVDMTSYAPGVYVLFVEIGQAYYYTDKIVIVR